MLLDYFKQYIRITRNVSESTVNHYVTGINTINALLRKNGFFISNVFEITTVEELEMVKAFLFNNEEFIKKDTVGNRMYSVAFNHFYGFACEDKQFYKKQLDKMDIVIPKKKISLNETWKRNKIVSAQALEFADYSCECNDKHSTFTAASNGKMYMEGHHLIPMKFQSEFDVSLDIYANIICLCPICHRLMHYGIHSEKEYHADKLFENRKDRLIHSGIDITKNDFKQLISI